MRRIEVWADSFHEGDWCCENLAKIHERLGQGCDLDYQKAFIPVYRFAFDKDALEIVVYGSYGTWSPMPDPIKQLIAWGKPDFIAYDPEKEEVLFAVEETAAIPTGNQALQRCERLYGSARAGIPFWYLLAEFGRHKDGGIRRDSIWPTIMALKLSANGKAPSAVLHYADVDNPEGYDFGSGVEALFASLYKILQNFAAGKEPMEGLKEDITEHYRDMLRFVRSQYQNIIPCVPGLDDLDDKQYSRSLAGVSLGKGSKEVREHAANYDGLMVWPDTKTWKRLSGAAPKGGELLKHDELCSQLESSLDKGVCYNIGGNAGSRPQKKESVKAWIGQQRKSFTGAAKSLSPSVAWELKLSDFPATATGNLHVTTAKNILYLFDKFSALKDVIYRVYPRLKGKLDSFESTQHVLVYISNSLKPGRIFGDPFTGQIAAYATAFGRLDTRQRLVVAYFPHQSYAQMIDSDGKLVKNKGFVLMRELVDVIVFGGGVAVVFDDDGRGQAL